ncbi:MAG: hypothetical protein WC710_14925 [Gallionella sp.]|jgi:hypothetical protein
MNLPNVPVQTDYFALGGGLDLETPPIVMKPGVLREGLNVECSVNGGYDRSGQYERFDGQAAPTAAVFEQLPATITGSWAWGNTITGVTSGETASIVSSNATGFIITKSTGAFTATENLQISAVTVAVCTATNYTGGNATALLGAQYQNLSADVYRALITAIPGSGNVLGVWMLGDVLYGFRNNAGGTACDIYKSSAAGWVQVTLFNEISFTAGAVAIPAEGATLTQGAVTATLKRVVQTTGTGTFASGNAAGRFIITNPSGGNFAAGAATLTGGVTCTLSGAQTAIALTAGGRYEFENSNMGGATGATRMYGCSGVNRAFEFDGTVYVPITTGMATDTPLHLKIHKNHLFLSFGASVQHSGTSFPYLWNPVYGAAEISMGETVSAFDSQIGTAQGGALLIFTRNTAKMLYGSSSLDWQLVTVQEEAGAIPYTIQHLSQTTVLDDRGITQFGQSQAYGNFESATISKNIRRWMIQQKSKVVASMICREKNQYRLFFSDGYALYVTFAANKLMGMVPQLFPSAATCCCSQEWSSGDERMFFGDASGYVYELDSGTSFDGANISWYANLSYSNKRSPGTLKRWRSALPEIAGTAYSEFTFGYSLDYGDSKKLQPSNSSGTLEFGGGGIWDEFIWDEFIWDGNTLSPGRFSIGGSSENISLMFSGDSDYIEPFSITGVVMQYTPRRRSR